MRCGNAAQRKQMEQQLEPLAWSDEFLGRALYVPVNQPEDFKAITGLKSQAAYVVIQPDIFGLKGRVIQEISFKVTAAQLKHSLAAIPISLPSQHFAGRSLTPARMAWRHPVR